MCVCALSSNVSKLEKYYTYIKKRVKNEKKRIGTTNQLTKQTPQIHTEPQQHIESIQAHTHTNTYKKKPLSTILLLMVLAIL